MLDAKRAVCAGYWAQCRASFAGQEAKENLFNCLEVFGFNKTAGFCLEQQGVLSENFHYPLKNKYECLSAVSGPASNVTLLEEASACLNVFFDYLVEKCLEKMEADYNGNIGFTGSLSPPSSEDPLAWKDVYFTSYGNTSLS